MRSRCANHEEAVRTQTFPIQQVVASDVWGFGCVIRLLPRSRILFRALPLPMTGTREVFCFGEFELDVDAAELRRKDRRLKLQPQPFKLLVLLVRKAGALVTREEIRHELWPDGTFVDFDQSVNFSVKQIRDALGDEADRPLHIETVPGAAIGSLPQYRRPVSRRHVIHSFQWGRPVSDWKRRSGRISRSCGWQKTGGDGTCGSPSASCQRCSPSPLFFSCCGTKPH